MKKIIQSLLACTALAAICFTSSSFSAPKGGEGYEIYLNGQLLVQHFGTQIDNPTKIQLDRRFANEQLTVKYFHCGQMGKNRDITIKDNENRILKEWHFADGSSSPSMNCPVKEILSVQNNNDGQVNLFYTSSELPKGRLLTTIAINNSARP